jgi:hypothetical protein
VLLWQDFCARGQSLYGAIDTFTLEPSNNPGRYVSDASEPEVMDAGASMHAELFMTWRDLDDA